VQAEFEKHWRAAVGIRHVRPEISTPQCNARVSESCVRKRGRQDLRSAGVDFSAGKQVFEARLACPFEEVRFDVRAVADGGKLLFGQKFPESLEVEAGKFEIDDHSADGVGRADPVESIDRLQGETAGPAMPLDAALEEEIQREELEREWIVHGVSGVRTVEVNVFPSPVPVLALPDSGFAEGAFFDLSVDVGDLHESDTGDERGVSEQADPGRTDRRLPRPARAGKFEVELVKGQPVDEVAACFRFEGGEPGVAELGVRVPILFVDRSQQRPGEFEEQGLRIVRHSYPITFLLRGYRESSGSSRRLQGEREGEWAAEPQS
jgi:hypothetical protein